MQIYQQNIIMEYHNQLLQMADFMMFKDNLFIEYGMSSIIIIVDILHLFLILLCLCRFSILFVVGKLKIKSICLRVYYLQGCLCLL